MCACQRKCFLAQCNHSVYPCTNRAGSLNVFRGLNRNRMTRKTVRVRPNGVRIERRELSERLLNSVVKAYELACRAGRVRPLIAAGREPVLQHCGVIAGVL